VQVSDVRYQGFNGTFVGGLAIDLDCTSCFNIVLDKINIVSSQPKNTPQAFCKNFHGKIGSTVPRVSCL
jgi:galacturan 1,4-alpha-galacturonidase